MRTKQFKNFVMLSWVSFKNTDKYFSLSQISSWKKPKNSLSSEKNGCGKDIKKKIKAYVFFRNMKKLLAKRNMFLFSFSYHWL